MENSTKIRIGGHKKITPSEVIAFKGDVNYTEIAYKNGKKLVVAMTLKQLRLSNFGFCRVHRRYLINLAYVSAIFYDKKRMLITLQNQEQIQVSRRRLKGFCEAWEGKNE